MKVIRIDVVPIANIDKCVLDYLADNDAEQYATSILFPIWVSEWDDGETDWFIGWGDD